MTGFELRISGVGIDRSTNWATTTAQASNIVCCIVIILTKEYKFTDKFLHYAKITFELFWLKLLLLYLLSQIPPNEVTFQKSRVLQLSRFSQFEPV